MDGSTPQTPQEGPEPGSNPKPTRRPPRNPADLSEHRQALANARAIKFTLVCALFGLFALKMYLRMDREKPRTESHEKIPPGVEYRMKQRLALMTIRDELIKLHGSGWLDDVQAKSLKTDLYPNMIPDCGDLYLVKTGTSKFLAISITLPDGEVLSTGLEPELKFLDDPKLDHAELVLEGSK